jgi:hypothetical protein
MPWPWGMARACLDMQTGNVTNWPMPQMDYDENAYLISAMLQVWRTWALFHKPRGDWTADDTKFYSYIHKRKRAEIQARAG